jgi:hypothetical protein
VLTKHIDDLIEAYLDDRLSTEARQRVEAHIKRCPICAQRLFDAQRLSRELGPVLRHVIGQPTPSPMLRQKVRLALQEEQVPKPFYVRWTTPLRVFNAVGNAALLALLAVGVLIVTRGQAPWTSSSAVIADTSPSEASPEVVIAITPTPLVTLVALPETPPSTPAQFRSSLGDIIQLTVLPTPVSFNSQPTFPPQQTPLVNNNSKATKEPSLATVPEPDDQPQLTPRPPLPGGIIAFALFDSTPGVEMYVLHVINPDGSQYLPEPFKGVSEPALHPATNDYTLALRAWEEATHPRKLLTTNFSTSELKSITNFWEDAQPDWSPTENRVIFASQRESDRRWRLYTIWGDGSNEKNLRREGRSPTFAPDGYRFAFESCDNSGNNCGLWLGDLEHSEYGSVPFLKDPLAKSPDWSPIGDEIAYMANPGGNWDLYLVNSNGDHIRRLTEDPADDGLPAWSPDGKWLAFVSNRDGSWGIWILHIASGDLRKIVTFENDSLTPPSRLPYNEHGKRSWWDEQISWGSS